jgi:hypothetical protein
VKLLDQLCCSSCSMSMIGGHGLTFTLRIAHG